MAKTISKDEFRRALVAVVKRTPPDVLLAKPGVEDLLSAVLYDETVKEAAQLAEDDGDPVPGTPEAAAALAARPAIDEED